MYIPIALQGLISSADLLLHNVLNTRKAPVNYILLVVFSINQSIFYGAANIALKLNIIWVGVGVSAILCFLLAILGHKISLNTVGKCVLIAANVSALAGLVILAHYYEKWLYGFLFAILIVNYLNYNLLRMMDGKRKNPIHPEDFIMAAIHVYLVILEIVKEIIEELQSKENEDEEEKQNTIAEEDEIETTMKEK